MCDEYMFSKRELTEYLVFLLEGNLTQLITDDNVKATLVSILLVASYEAHFQTQRKCCYICN
jgi:hypothetical protein